MDVQYFCEAVWVERAIKWLAKYFRMKCHEWNIPHAKACRKPESDLASTEGSSTKFDDVSPEESSTQESGPLYARCFISGVT